MSKFKDTDGSRDIGTTRATANLPGLTIEISHHHPPEGDREEISIKVQARPSFEGAGSLFQAMNPLAFWANATQMFWFSWLQFAHAMSLSSDVAPSLPSTGPGRPSTSPTPEREPSHSGDVISFPRKD